MTCCEGTEGEYRYSSTLCLTSAMHGGGWSTSRPGRFTPGNNLLPTANEAGQSKRARKIFLPPGYTPRTVVQPTASCYTDCAVPAHPLTQQITTKLHSILMRKTKTRIMYYSPWPHSGLPGLSSLYRLLLLPSRRPSICSV
jgi:hypothetical protein